MDTDVLVSAYTARGVSADLVSFILAQHEVFTGEVNLGELRRVLRDRFHASKDQLDAVEAQLRAQTIVPRPSQAPPIALRDPDDRWVLASAIAGAAELLVTGDQDLLAVADEAPVPIVDPRGCWERLRSGS